MGIGTSINRRTILHRVRLCGSKHYVTQVARSVQVFKARRGNRDTVGFGKLVKVFRPPKTWGRDWAWHLNDQGVVFTWTKLDFAKTGKLKQFRG